MSTGPSWRPAAGNWGWREVSRVVIGDGGRSVGGDWGWREVSRVWRLPPGRLDLEKFSPFRTTKTAWRLSWAKALLIFGRAIVRFYDLSGILFLDGTPWFLYVARTAGEIHTTGALEANHSSASTREEVVSSRFTPATGEGSEQPCDQLIGGDAGGWPGGPPPSLFPVRVGPAGEGPAPWGRMGVM